MNAAMRSRVASMLSALLAYPQPCAKTRELDKEIEQRLDVLGYPKDLTDAYLFAKRHFVPVRSDGGDDAGAEMWVQVDEKTGAVQRAHPTIANLIGKPLGLVKYVCDKRDWSLVVRKVVPVGRAYGEYIQASAELDAIADGTLATHKRRRPRSVVIGVRV